MIRNALTALAATVLMASLLAGQCVACQPLLNQPTSCCKPSGKCETPSPGAHKDCLTAAMPLDQYVQAEPAALVAVDVPQDAGAAPVATAVLAVSTPAYSPPLLYLRNSALLL